MNNKYWEDRVDQAKKELDKITDIDRKLLDAYTIAVDEIRLELMHLYSKIDSNNATLTDFHNYNRLSNTESNIRRIIRALGTSTRKMTKDAIIKAIKQGFYMELDIDFSLPNKEVIEKMATTPWSGLHFSERVWRNTDDLEYALNDILRRGIIQGKTVSIIAREIASYMDNSYKRSTTLVRTEMMHYFNEAAKERYAQAGVKKVIWYTASDERTCSVCGGLHNKEYKIDKAPIIPAHPNCRCTYIPVV